MTVEQLDITTAYLNGTLSERIHMEVPNYMRQGLEFLKQTESKQSHIRKVASQMLQDLESGNKVCLLNKAIYGLRQAGRCWNEKLSQTLLEFGAKKSSSDPCIFFKGKERPLLLIAIYVDDILIACQDKSEITKLKNFLSKRFEVKDLGPIKYCLGIKFNQKEDSITLNQKGYIRDLLERFGMTEANTVSTPLDPNVKLEKTEEDPEHEKIPYQELIGSLLYLATCTRPDISYSVSYLSQFNTCFSSIH